jgi:hypothetical protein
MGNSIKKCKADDTSSLSNEPRHDKIRSSSLEEQFIWKIRRPAEIITKIDESWKAYTSAQVRTLDWYDFGHLKTGDEEALLSALRCLNTQEIQLVMQQSILEFFRHTPTTVDEKYDHWRFILPAIQQYLLKVPINWDSTTWQMFLRMLHRPSTATIEYQFYVERGQEMKAQTRLFILENQLVSYNLFNINFIGNQLLIMSSLTIIA